MSNGVGYMQLNPGLKSRINSGGGSGGSGGSFIVQPIYSSVKLTANSSTVDINIGSFNMDFDTIFVFKNSVFMRPNEYYSVISNKQIQATGGEVWSSGTEFDFVVLSTQRAPSALRQISIENSIDITADASYIKIGISDFVPDDDTILLFKNGVFQKKGIHFTCDATNIYPKGETVFAASTDNPVNFAIIILRNIADASVIEEFFTDKVGDLNTLKTTAKTNAIAAINEVKDTTTTLGSNIGTLSTLKTTAKGSTVAAINEVKDATTTLGSNIGTLSSLLTTAKGSTVAAINELFQSGVEITNIAKSALDAAGIGYSNTQLKTLVNSMGSNLYTKAMKDQLINAIANAGGSANANDFNSIINSIGSISSNGKTYTIKVNVGPKEQYSTSLQNQFIKWESEINIIDLVPGLDKAKGFYLLYKDPTVDNDRVIDYYKNELFCYKLENTVFCLYRYYFVDGMRTEGIIKAATSDYICNENLDNNYDRGILTTSYIEKKEDDLRFDDYPEYKEVPFTITVL